MSLGADREIGNEEKAESLILFQQICYLEELNNERETESERNADGKGEG